MSNKQIIVFANNIKAITKDTLTIIKKKQFKTK